MFSAFCLWGSPCPAVPRTELGLDVGKNSLSARTLQRWNQQLGTFIVFRGPRCSGCPPLGLQMQTFDVGTPCSHMSSQSSVVGLKERWASCSLEFVSLSWPSMPVGLCALQEYRLYFRTSRITWIALCFGLVGWNNILVNVHTENCPLFFFFILLWQFIFHSTQSSKIEVA